MKKDFINRMAILAVDGIYYHCAYEEHYNPCEYIDNLKEWSLGTLTKLKQGEYSNDEIINIIESCEKYTIELNRY